MGVNWAEKEFNIEIILYTEKPQSANSNKIYKETNQVNVSGFGAFGTIAYYKSGFQFYAYSKSNTTKGTYIQTVTTQIDDEEPSSRIYTGELNYNSFISYTVGNENIKESGDGYKKFSEVIEDLESKWNDEIGKGKNVFVTGYGIAGGQISTINNIIINGGSGYDTSKITINLSYSSDGDFPLYFEPSAGDMFGGFENGYELVSTMVEIPYADLGINGITKNITTLKDGIRYYTLMNLISNFGKWGGGTGDQTAESRLDIYVNMDGTKKPNTNIHWKAKAKYGVDSDFSKYKFDIYTMGSGGENKILLGSFPLDSKDTITFSNNEMQAGRPYSGNYLQLAFNSDWLKSEWWTATIFDNVSDFSENYNKLSAPSKVPEIHITVNDRSGGDEEFKDDGDGDNEDDGDGGKDEDSGGSGGSGVNPHSLLTTTYVLTPGRIQQVGSVLWESNFMENILLINNAPIENILSVKMFPFVFPSGTDTQIKIGNVSMGVNGQLLSNSYNYRHDIGSVSIPKHYNSFLDFAPYTRLIIYLPYYGVTELDCSVYMGRTLSVSYIIDVVVGSCLINVYANGILTNQFSSQVGVDIPITSSNRAQVESAIVTNGLKSLVTADIGGMANTLIEGGLAKYHTQTSGSPSSACGMYAYKNPMVIIDRPSYSEITGYAHSVGRTCLQQKQIKSIRGYTEMSDSIDLTGIPATSTELEEIKNILTTGFYA